MSTWILRDARPVVGHPEAYLDADDLGGGLHSAAGLGALDRIVEELLEHPQDPGPVDAHRGERGVERRLPKVLPAGAVGGPSERGAQQLGRILVRELERQVAGADRRDVHEVGHDRDQPVHVAPAGPQQLAGLLGEPLRGALDEGERGLQRRQRRLQLVAEVREEPDLVALVAQPAATLLHLPQRDRPAAAVAAAEGGLDHPRRSAGNARDAEEGVRSPLLGHEPARGQAVAQGGERGRSASGGHAERLEGARVGVRDAALLVEQETALRQRGVVGIGGQAISPSRARAIMSGPGGTADVAQRRKRIVSAASSFSRRRVESAGSSSW
jgi:hypothetical protein